MNLMIKSMLLLTMISIPAIDAVSSDGAWSKAVGFVHQVTTGSTSVRAKDETRLAPVARADLANLLGTAGPTSHEPSRAADAVRIAQAFGPAAFGAPPVPRGAFAPIGPHMGMGPPPPTRAACEDHIDVEIGMAAYVKAKLRLQPSQREAWQKLETAAQGAIDKVRAACAGFPADANVPASLPEMLDAVEADLSARAEFLRATREPLRALFAALTPEQRVAAQPLLPPPHRP
jgi:hypothetical protein